MTLAAAALAALSPHVAAEGSRTLYPTGHAGNRANMDLDAGVYAGIVRRTQFTYVHARAGEWILFGSSNRRYNGDVLVYAPAAFGPRGNENFGALTPSFRCSTGPVATGETGFYGGTYGADLTGYVESRAAELAGPNSADNSVAVAGGYRPCAYQVPTTGIYGVRFTGASGTGSSNAGPGGSLTVAQLDLQASVWSWDVTVRASATSTSDVNGRVFTYAWAAYSGGSAASGSLRSSLYYVTGDGYRYRQTMRGLMPIGFASYANSAGFLDQSQPLYKDVRGSNQTLSAFRPAGITGLAAQPPQYPIFFSDVSDSTNVTEVERVLTALSIPLVPTPPLVTAVAYNGNVAGNQSTIGAGGAFVFTTVNTISYQIVIKRGATGAGDVPANCVDDFDPANVCNRVITGAAAGGTHTVTWDGLDNSGSTFPVGDYQFQLSGRNGEVHFPFVDAEGNANGGPSVVKLNGPTAGTADADLVYFDDRGYISGDNTLVGIQNGHICGNNALPQPSPNHSLVGIHSDDANWNGTGRYYRSWTTDGNPNNDCSGGSQGFGDAKGLDSWAYEISTPPIEDIEVIDPVLGVDVATQVSVTAEALQGGTVYGNFQFSNNGNAAANGVTYAVTLGNAADPSTCPATVNFTAVPTGVTATYNPAPACTITFSGMPTTLNPGQVLAFAFNYVVLPTNFGPIPLTSAIQASNETGTLDNNTDAGITVVTNADLEISKTGSTTVPQGQVVTYTVTVWNNGPSNITGAAIADDVPAQLTGVTWTCTATGLASCGTPGGSGNDIDLTANLPTDGGADGVAENHYVTLAITGTASGAAGVITNTATVTAPNGISDPDPTNNEDSHDTQVVASFPFCPAAGDPAQVFNIVNGVNIYAYTPPGTAPDVLVPLNPATMSGDLNALMLDPVRNRLLMIQRSSSTQSTLWAYDAANGGWYVAFGPFTSSDFPRGGFNAAGTGYLLTGGASPQVWQVVSTSLYGYTVTNIGTMNYDNAPTDAGSGDIAFDGDGMAWLVVGQDIYHLDVSGTSPFTAVRQTRPTLGGSPSTINWAGIAFADDGTLILANNAPSPSAYYRYDPTSGTIVHRVNTTPNAARDLTSCAFPVQPVPELSVVKTLNQVNGAAPGPLVYPGDVLRYAITISNTGGAVGTLFANDVQETVPANSTHVAGDSFTCATPAAGSACGNTAAVNVPAAGSITLYFTVQLDSPLPTAQIANAVAIPGEVDCSATPNDCTEITPVGPRLTMAKTLQSGGPMAQPGGGLVYAITLTNLTGVPGSVAAGAIGEIVPANTTHAGGDSFTCAAATAGSSCSNTAALVVPANGSLVLTFAVTVDNPIAAGVSSIANTATPPPGVTCPSCTVTTPTAPNVTIVKALTGENGSQAGVAEAGETLTWTITLTNSGGSAFTNYDFTENVPNGATLTSVAGAGVTACATPLPGAGTCPVTVASVPANGSTTVTIVFAVANPIPAGTTSILNLVSGGDIPPGCPAPNVCSTTTPTAPSVTIVKTLTAENGSQAGIAEPGETLTYTITLTNSGGAATTNYGVTDQLDANVDFVSATNGGSHAGGTVTWTNLTVAAGGSLVLTVVVTVDDPLPAGVTQVLNLAYETGTTPPSCPPAGSQCVVTPTAANVTLVKALAAESGTQAGVAEPGETLTYTVTLTNGGGTAFPNYDFTENVPANVTLGSVSGAGVTACTTPLPGAGTCAVTVASVPANGSTTVTIVFTVANPIPAGVTSIANLVSGGDIPPDCPSPNVCSVTTPTAPSVTVVKALTAESGSQAGVAEPGETLTWTITLTNSGGSAFTNYDFTENVPNGATLTSVTGAGVTACATPVIGAGTCAVTVANVPANASTTVTIVFTVADPIPAGVTSIVNLVDGGDIPPGCPSPNVCSTTTPTEGRVAIAKTVADANGNGIAEPGETLTWTITLSNNGGSAVSGYGLTDPLDANTSFISATNGGAHAGGVVTWTGLTVPAQVGAVPGTLVLTVVTMVNTPIPDGVRFIANLVHETGGTPPDCSATPTPANCASIPTAANVTVAKSLSGESITADGIAEPGEQLTYTITLRNHGGSVASNVIVNEIVPLHTTFVGGAPTWSCAAGSPAGTACDSVVNVPAADAGGSPGVTTLTFIVQVVDPLPAGVTRIANAVALDDGTPPDCTANPTHPACVVTPTINLNLVKSVESVTATGPGTYWVAYRIDLANTGGSPVTYTLTDTPDFTPMGVTVTGNGIAATTSGTLNPALPGGAFAVANGTAVQLSANGVTLAVGATHSYTVRIPIAVSAGSLGNAVCTGAPGNGLYNRASVTGSFAQDSSTCAPVSGEQPLIRLVKSVRLGVDNNGDHYGNVGDVLHYTFAISNPGSVTLSAIDLIDPRVTDLQCDATTAYGEPMRVLRGDELFIGVFEELLGGSLVPGDSITCSATYTITAQDVPNRRVVNTATTHGAGSDGQVVMSTSTAIYTNIR